MRRILTWLGPLVAVTTLALLHGVFLQERSDALAALDRQGALIERLARAELEGVVSTRLRDAWTRIGAAWKNPLVPLRGGFYVKGGEVLLPRAATATEPPPLPATCEAPAQASPLWQSRCRERTLEAVVATVARFASPPAFEIAALLEQVPAASSSWQVALLREGAQLATGERIEGVQTRLLREAGHFDKHTFDKMVERVRAASEAAQVPYDDFLAAAETIPLVPALPSRAEGPMLVPGGILGVRPDGALYGESLDTEALATSLDDALRSRGALAKGERVDLPVIDTPRALREVPFSMMRPAALKLARRADTRLAAKLALTWVCFALVLAVAWLERRRRRAAISEVESKRAWLGAVAHEIRTPLASMRLLAETLERKTRAQPEVRDYPARLRRDLEQTSELVENILAFKRIRSGAASLSRRRVMLGELLGRVRETLEAHLDIALELRIEDGALDVDPAYAELVFANLMRNGAYYAPMSPLIVAYHAPNCVRFSDMGPGIADPSDLFRPYHRGSNVEGVRGSGLGLALCAAVLKAHGGSIRYVAGGAKAGRADSARSDAGVSDPPGGGACFELDFGPAFPRSREG